MKARHLAVLFLGAPLAAQAVTIQTLINVRYLQMTDDSYRLDNPASKYVPFSSAFKENGFTLSRTEIYLSGKVMEGLSWNAMFDPSVKTTSYTSGDTAPAMPTILLDAFITYAPTTSLSFRLGQFKPMQTYESNTANAELILYDRSMLARMVGDRRDRGVLGIYTLGDASDWNGAVMAGVFNGASDREFGMANDQNAQKDFVGRVNVAFGTTHRFGAYGRWGASDAPDKGGRVAFPVAGNAPSTETILQNGDRTTNLGAFYVLDLPNWQAQAEVVTGLLGRRFPAVGLAPAPATPNREHLDQRFLGYQVTGAYRTGHHLAALRYDVLDFNAGHDWYTAANPYLTAQGDFSPRFMEVTGGYTYFLDSTKWKQACVKLNYVWRKKNFLLPSGAQAGPQGSDSVVAVFQVGF
jgi:hypothetical protein